MDEQGFPGASDPGASDDDVAEAIAQLGALEAAVRAQLLALVTLYETREAFKTDGALNMASWLVARLGWSYSSAARAVEVARGLARLPATAAALGEGRLSYDQVAVVVDMATEEDDERWAREAPGMSVAGLEAARRRARAVSRQEAERRHQARRLRMRHLEGGLALSGFLPDEQGAALERAIVGLASKASPHPDGSYDPFEARCADALASLADGSLAQRPDASAATLVLHVEPQTLAGGGGLAHIEGGPDVAAETARRLACDARMQVSLEEPGGQPLGLGRLTRKVPAWMSRQLRLRDGGCRFGGCRSGYFLHAHHRRHWADGGPTDLGNLLLLCPFHHRFVHESGWKIEGDPAGELRFVDHSGRVLSSKPTPLRDEARSRVLDPLALFERQPLFERPPPAERPAPASRFTVRC
ncbi:MAG: DUF222 domain-containing protein [Acidimicrobiales bacterium]